LFACLAMVLSVTWATPAHAAQHVWVFAGQSNMVAGRNAYEKALRPVVEAAGHELVVLNLAWSGNPIENWLDPSRKDYERNWGRTEAAIKQARDEGKTIAGVLWYQGEANVGPGTAKYPQQMAELVAKYRDAAGEPKLPFILAQLAAGTSTYRVGEWTLGIMREGQRRFALSDEQVELVATTDCNLGDRVVHIDHGPDGHDRIAQRFAATAVNMVYGQAVGLGPRIAGVRFGNAQRTVVVVELKGVRGEVKLEDEAVGQFFVSEGVVLPAELSEMGDPAALPPIYDDHRVPEAYAVRGNSVALRFADPVAEGAALSWATTEHAALGPGRRWDVAFARMTDDTGFQTPSFAAMPIAAFTGERVDVPGPSLLPPVAKDMGTVAVNFGKNPLGVLGPDDVAGYDAWRQSHWNPTARFVFTRLYNNQAKLTPIFVNSYVHFGTRLNERPGTPDAVLAATGQPDLAQVAGLEPGAAYDVLVYLWTEGEQPGAWVYLAAHHLKPRKSKPGQRPAKPESIRQAGQRIGGVEGEVLKPEDWRLATEENDYRGNVMRFDSVDAGPMGIVEMHISAPRPDKADTPNPATIYRIAGLQIRRSADDPMP